MTDLDHRRLAKHLDRRRVRRRMTLWTLLLGAVIAAATYLRCGSGWGIGGKGAGEGGTTQGTASDSARCSIRLSAKGITVNGEAVKREQAIARCKGKIGADVLITGNARQGDWDELRGALEAAGIPFFTREPRGVTPADAGKP